MSKLAKRLDNISFKSGLWDGYCLGVCSSIIIFCIASAFGVYQSPYISYITVALIIISAIVIAKAVRTHLKLEQPRKNIIKIYDTP
ncbi:hypothetical protein KAJ61_01580 [Candidatus Parcubacteria bacterium]|nr:hypothetical protein [Candidatus Parcubacteria bacterium]